MAYTPLDGSRRELLGHGSSSSRAIREPSGWSTGDTDDEETEDTRNMSVNQLRQQQYTVLEEQDRGLEALSEVITRQKQLAQVIGNEVDYQNDLIEDITDHVDRTRDRLVGETNRVRTIDRKDNTCRYWVIIILLFVAIVIIIAI